MADGGWRRRNSRPTGQRGRGRLDRARVLGAADLSRASQMARRYALGETLQEIGNDYGVTRERTRQIINTETPWSTTSIGAARRRALEMQAAAERRAVLEWSEANVGAPIEQAVEQLKLDEELVRKHLGRHRIRHELVEKKAPERRSLDDLLSDLRRFHAETGEMSAAAYRRWAKEAGVPGHQTIAIRFGSWNDAVARAGIKDAPPIERERRYSDEDLWAAVLDGIRAGQFTAKEFEEWLVTVEGAPSLATIRNRLPERWNELRDEALRILGGRSDRDDGWIETVSSPRDWPSFLDVEDPMVHMRAARLALGKNITMVRYAEWAQATKRPGVMPLFAAGVACGGATSSRPWVERLCRSSCGSLMMSSWLGCVSSWRWNRRVATPRTRTGGRRTAPLPPAPSPCVSGAGKEPGQRPKPADDVLSEPSPLNMPSELCA